MNRYSRGQIEKTLRTFHQRLAIAKDTKMNLADSSQRQRFVTMLEAAEKAAARGHVPKGESDFIDQMREKFDSREDATDLGMTPWSPTLKQWNWLHNIVSML